MFVAEGTNIGRIKSQYTSPGYRKNVLHLLKLNLHFLRLYILELVFINVFLHYKHIKNASIFVLFLSINDQNCPTCFSMSVLSLQSVIVTVTVSTVRKYL